MEKRTTIYGIARDLNLSPGTISKVINNTGNVSNKTRKLVLDYIKEVGYVPSSSARRLKSSRTYTIGVIFSEDLNIGLEQSFFSSILQHFKDYAENKGYELSFIVRKLGNNTLSYYEWCLNKRVDGVYIVVGNYDDPEIIEVINSKIPCVSNDMIVDDLHSVISDNDSGVLQMLTHVRDNLKLSKVAMISGPFRSKAFLERANYYKENVSKLGLESVGFVKTKGFGFNSGYEGLNELLKTSQPEVILVSSDDLSIGVLKALNDQGIKVPEDIQVIGYDDINFAKYFSPPLTTIRQNRKELGERAAKDLIAHIEQGIDSSNEVVRIPVELIERETTKK